MSNAQSTDEVVNQVVDLGTCVAQVYYNPKYSDGAHVRMTVTAPSYCTDGGGYVPAESVAVSMRPDQVSALINALSGVKP